MDLQGDIIKAFETADEDQRLSLFLTHRDLRPQFTDIYMYEKSQKLTIPAKLASGVRTGNIYKRFADQCWGWLKCCRVAKQDGAS